MLEGPSGEEASNLCADEPVMRLDPPGDRSRHYRAYVAPPGAR